MKVSFDFDHTLTSPQMQELAKQFIAIGAEVHITTSRFKQTGGRKLLYDNREVFSMAERLGISQLNITFTEGEDKYKFLKGFDLHFDDDDNEIFLINDFPGKCIGFLFND
jgi:hypothetical protein